MAITEKHSVLGIQKTSVNIKTSHNMNCLKNQFYYDFAEQ